MSRMLASSLPKTTRLQDYKIYFVSMSHNLHHEHYDEHEELVSLFLKGIEKN